MRCLFLDYSEEKTFVKIGMCNMQVFSLHRFFIGDFSIFHRLFVDRELNKNVKAFTSTRLALPEMKLQATNSR